MTPLVSIIVVCYNHQEFISECLLSILLQDYPYKEVIVVDNGSTDASLQEIRRLAKNFDIQVIENPKNGVHLAFRLGRARASGKYIVTFSSDDVMAFGRLTAQVEFLENNLEYAACFGNILCIDERSNISGQLNRILVKEADYDFEQVFTKHVNLYSPTHMYRMSVYDEVGGYDEAFKIEDLALYFSILHRGYKFATLNKLLAYYRIHQNNIHTNYEYMYENKFRLIENYREHILYPKALRQFYLEHFSVFGSYNKIKCITLLPKVIGFFYNKYFLLGLVRLLFDWRRYARRM